MELPPNPNIPDGMPIRNPRMTKRMNVRGATGAIKKLLYLNLLNYG